MSFSGCCIPKKKGVEGGIDIHRHLLVSRCKRKVPPAAAAFSFEEVYPSH